MEAVATTITNYKTLNIGIDIDDTLCNFGHEFITYLNKKNDTKHDINNMYDYDYASFIGRRREYIHHVTLEFTDEYIDKLTPFDNALNALKKIQGQFNCKIYIITARSEKYRVQTTKWINTHFPGIFNGIEFTNTYDEDPSLKKRTKYEICESLGINILIDDRYDIIRDCMLKNRAFLGIIFERPWSIVLNNNLFSIKNWNNFSLKHILNVFIHQKSNKHSTYGIEEKDITIGISGKTGSGKNTLADIIKDEFPFYFEEYAFANRLKKVTSILTGVPLNNFHSKEGKAVLPSGFNYTCGQLLQIVGEGLCKSIDENLWVKCLDQESKISKRRIITDVRKVIEFDYCSKNESIMIRIERNKDDIIKLNTSNRDLNHSSEIQLDNYRFDYVIYNDGTIEDLKTRFLYYIYPCIYNKIFGY